MITEKHTFVTDCDDKEFKTRDAAEDHEVEYDKIKELKEALQTIHDFCKWFRNEKTDACCDYTFKCPLYDLCSKLGCSGCSTFDKIPFTVRVDNLKRTMPNTVKKN